MRESIGIAVLFLVWVGWTLVFRETKPWMDRVSWIGWAGYFVIIFWDNNPM